MNNNEERRKELQTCLLKNQATEITKLTDTANTLLARDYKGHAGNEKTRVVVSRQAEKRKES